MNCPIQDQTRRRFVGSILSMAASAGAAENKTGVVNQSTLRAAPDAISKNSPRAWGAVADGLADDSAAVLACLQSVTDAVLDGVFCVAGLKITNAKLKTISGPGTLKLAKGANTHLATFIGTQDLLLRHVSFDGSKATQGGATQATRSDFIAIMLPDATTQRTSFVECQFFNCYFGAALNNSATETLVKNCLFYDCGNTPLDGTCDGVFNGKSASRTRILNNSFVNCSDYAVACDTSDILVQSNKIKSCFAGIGALTRGTIFGHKILMNSISECHRPIDYFNSAVDSNPLNLFKNILIDKNSVSGTKKTTAVISFAANNSVLKLCESVGIKRNVIHTYENSCSAVGVGGCPAAKNSNIEISENKIYGDGRSKSTRYGINVTNTVKLTLLKNTLDGVDFAIALTGCEGDAGPNTFKSLRASYSIIDTPNMRIRENLKDIPKAGRFLR